MDSIAFCCRGRWRLSVFFGAGFVFAACIAPGAFDDYELAAAAPESRRDADSGTAGPAQRSQSASTPARTGRSTAGMLPPPISVVDAALPKQTMNVPGDSSASPDGVTQDADAGKPAADSGRRVPEVSGTVFEVVKETKTDPPVFNIFRPKQLAGAGAPWPVIAWASCTRNEGPANPLSERWAAAGFVVFSLASVSADVPALGLTTENEHRALVDAVFATSARGEYTGQLDLDRIAVAGNACGGLSALQLAAHDDRLAAVFVLSGSSDIVNADGNVISAINIPVGYVVGSEQDISAANALADFNMLHAGLPAMIVRRASGDLITLSTDQGVLAEAADISLRWLDLALYGSHTAYDELISPNVCTRCTPGDWTLQRKNLEALLR